jgi:hypothetical protein
MSKTTFQHLKHLLVQEQTFKACLRQRIAVNRNG